MSTWELSEAYSAPQLAKRCVLFVLERYDEFFDIDGGASLHVMLTRMVPQLKRALVEDVARAGTASPVKEE